jgi:acetolactate synthase small subunit
MRHIISILIENESGALSRVAGLFSARGYNIESLTVAPTEDPSLSRMTILTSGSDEVSSRSPSSSTSWLMWSRWSISPKLRMSSAN